MSRMSIATYLSRAKQSLSRSLSSNGTHPASFVIGNESADLDSITCALVYGYIQSSTLARRKVDKLIIPITNIPSSQLRLRPELTALLKYADLNPSDLVTLDDVGGVCEALPPERAEWTLVDHNVLQGRLGERYGERVTGVIDHHDDEGQVSRDAWPRVVEKTGSCCSLVVEFCRGDWDSLVSGGEDVGRDTDAQDTAAANDGVDVPKWDAQVAKLALGAILIDTVNFKAEDKVTEHDRKAVDYLEAKIKASSKEAAPYDRSTFFEDVNNAKSNLDDLSVEEILEKDYKQWTEGDLTLGISSCVRSIKYLQSKDEELSPALLDFAKEKKKLDLYVVMTAHNDGASFERELLLLAISDGKAVKIADDFVDVESEGLELKKSSTELGNANVPWLKLWEQKNLSASRKQVGPALRDVMSKQ